MKKYLFEHASEIIRPGETIVPANRVLWKKANSLYEFNDRSVKIEFYEKLGGKWSILSERVATPVQSKAKPEGVKTQKKETADTRPSLSDIYGLSPDLYETVYDLEKISPGTIKKMQNWD
jgi:hypothetical protein